MSAIVLASTAVLIVAFIVLVLRAPGRAVTRPRRTLLFLAIVVLPLLWLAGALLHADATMKSVGFCLRCHEMEPYGESLLAGGSRTLSGSHYSGGWVDRERACYQCHTESTLAGEIGAKWRGTHDLVVHYLGTVPEEIELIEPYPNAICLSCHGPREQFLEEAGHAYPEALFDEVSNGRTSCMECHTPAH
jgi:nitrate/TMAO reductase-like tetraheme cytochrome c subunit